MKRLAMILAAGKGTRMKSAMPKVLHEALFHPILHYVIKAAGDVDADEICTVIGHGAEQVQNAFEGKTSFAVQKEQHGTGHAVKCGLPCFEKYTEGTCLVLCGDTPLLRGETLKELCEFHESENAAVTVMTSILDNPHGYGRIVRDDDGQIKSIVEQRDASPEEQQIKEINSGVYCFDLNFLRGAVEKLTTDNDQGELYLTDTISIARQDGKKAMAFVIDDYNEVRGINDRIQLAEAGEILKERKNKEVMASGVTLVNPGTIMIDPDAVIGMDTIIEPDTIIKGNCVIGEGCKIGPGSELENTAVGNGTRFWKSIAVNATMGDNCNIGPFAYMRPDTSLADNVKVGDFVELKNSTVGKGSKLPHLTYIGDSDVGEGCNIACGTITCNYDGFHKTRTVIGDRVFVGCNVNLVSPVHVEDDTYIAAGSTITKDIPGGSLAIARERQENKAGWAQRFRAINESDKKK